MLNMMQTSLAFSSYLKMPKTSYLVKYFVHFIDVILQVIDILKDFIDSSLDVTVMWTREILLNIYTVIVESHARYRRKIRGQP